VTSSHSPPLRLGSRRLIVVQAAAAVALALASAVCYAVSAVIQQREASRSAAGGLGLLAGLVRRRRWWAAVAASVAGALLHVAALGAGPLVLVQPLGVSTLAFALLIGTRTGASPVSRSSGLGAGCVVVGLPMVLSVIPHHPHAGAALLHYRWAAGAALAVVVAALVLARSFRSRPAVAAVSYAVAAATCFGLTSGTVRAVWLGHATPAAVAVGLASAGVGIALAQQAYHDGGLGAPLATLTLVDPLSAGALGVLSLGETLDLAPARLALAVCGGVATVLGVVLLSRRRRPARTDRPPPGTAGGRRHAATRKDTLDRARLPAPPAADPPGRRR
jgi:hypothetical protein